MSAYKDENLYHKQYMAIMGNDDIASKKFHELRETSLTLKYKFEDYGLTSVVAGFFLMAISFGGGLSLTSPKSKKRIIILGAIAVALNILTSISGFFLEGYRGSFAYWPDPTISFVFRDLLPFLGLFTLWLLAHLYFLREPFHCNVEIFKKTKFNISNAWLIIISALTAFYLGLMLVYGQFIVIIPVVFWLHFYFSLIAGKRGLLQ
jgi:hypothetical protein